MQSKLILFIVYDYGIFGVGNVIKKICEHVLPRNFEKRFIVSSGDSFYKYDKNITIVNNLNEYFNKIHKINNLIKRADIVHLNAHNFIHILLALNAFILRRPLITTFHNFFYDNSSAWKKIEMIVKKFFIINICFLISSKMTFLTSAQKSNFEKFSIFPKNMWNKKCLIIANFIESKIIRNAPKKIYGNNLKIIYVGRGTAIKGFNDLVFLTQKIQCIDFHIVGVAQNDFKNVIYHGFKKNDAVLSLYDKADIFILPSYLEVFPLTILEAMARGLVILVSDIPGMREIITEGRNGYLFPAGDIEKMNEIILFLKENPSEIKRISNNNLKDVWEYTAEVQGKKYIEIMKELL